MTTSDTQEAGMGMEEPDHEVIWLQPKCCADTDHERTGRQWCEDNVFECDNGAEATKYVRVDLHSTLTEENARLLQENKAMREALEKIDSWLVCYPITTDADICQSIPGMHKMVSTILTQGEGK